MPTEYEQLLQRLIEEKKAEIESLRAGKGKEKRIEALLSEIRYIELEVQHYSEGLALFRSRHVPRVGRWGKVEEEEGHAAQAPGGV